MGGLDVPEDTQREPPIAGAEQDSGGEERTSEGDALSATI